jgi:adenylate cyclase
MISPRQSIAWKISLLVLGSTFLVLALVAELMYTGARELIREEAENTARYLVSSLADEVEQEFLVVAEAADQLACSLGISGWGQETLLSRISATVKRNPRILGAQVNFTGRVESFTVGGQVLVSAKTYERLSDMVDLGDTLTVEMKGVPGQVLLYDVNGIKGDYSARLEDRDESVAKLEVGIQVHMFGMDQKILKSNGQTGTLTHASLKSARLVSKDKITLWEDLRLVFEDIGSASHGAEIYAKVVSVTPGHEGTEVVVRFTSVSPVGYQSLRHLLTQANDSTTQQNENPIYS